MNLITDMTLFCQDLLRILNTNRYSLIKLGIIINKSGQFDRYYLLCTVINGHDKKENFQTLSD